MTQAATALKLVVNEDRLVDTAHGVARLRLQIYEDGSVSLRAAPAKGEADEEVALAALRIVHEHAQAMELKHRALYRRYRNGRRSSDFHDVVDAIDLYEGDKAQELISQLPHLFMTVVH